MSVKERSLPTHRISRFSKFASLATRVAGNVITEGTKQIAKGNKPKAKDLLLTPQNIARLTDQLAHLRGAAMKLGQMLSMDAGDVLEPELADILSRLRSNADPMPAKQLNAVMESSLGTNWKAEFLSFNFKPIASASIGQVHQAYSDAGDNLAVKVQYPGIRKSIDSDVDNVGTLLKVVGLIPESVDYKGLLEEAKKQLHD
ncbi:AarF/UbiB family protein, partial [Vibrio parahaemolyticus]|nr:AarF/UbiB family protein [Vibrio parahaemolyticus]